MRNRIVFSLSAVGVLAALYSAYLFNERPAPQGPLFVPAANPYPSGIYAKGIVESYQSHGENINIYPEVSGPVTGVLVGEGEAVRKGQPLFTIDDSVQRLTAGQQRSQAQAACAELERLKAQPRAEVVEIAVAQVENANAALKNARDQLAIQEQCYASDPETISRLSLDNARNAARMAETALAVAEKQLALTRAGAWSYEIRSQEKQRDALSASAAAAEALAAKYTVRAPVDGVVLAVRAASGSYVSPAGAYGTYTGGFGPVVVMGSRQDVLAVRAYVDEVLVHRLPPTDQMTARMFVPGTGANVPLSFERIQPYVTPKIELSDQRQERVDVRVLPVVFRFQRPKELNVYPGQLVDVYIGGR